MSYLHSVTPAVLAVSIAITLTGCATQPQSYNTTGAAPHAAAFRACASQRATPLATGTDDALTIAAVAVDLCRAHAVAARAAIERDNGSSVFAVNYAAGYERGLQGRVTSETAAAVMALRAKR